jgi:hypothetical protein
MRKAFVLMLILAVCFIVVGKAEARGNWDPCSSHIGSKIWNSCIEIEKRRNEIGVGVDVIVYEGEEGDLLNKVTGEYKYDWQNGEHSAYAVATTKLSDIKAHVKELWGKIFNKGEDQ